MLSSIIIEPQEQASSSCLCPARKISQHSSTPLELTERFQIEKIKQRCLLLEFTEILLLNFTIIRAFVAHFCPPAAISTFAKLLLN